MIPRDRPPHGRHGQVHGGTIPPVIGFLGDVELSKLSPSPAEIDEVFSLSFEQLVSEDHRYEQTHSRGRMHVFDAGPWPVWGLTAFILAGVLTELFDLELPNSDVRPFEIPQ